MSSEGFGRAADNDVPDGAKSFIKAIQRSIKLGGSKVDASGKARSDIDNLYNDQFNKLTERYFKASTWPLAEDVTKFIEDGQTQTTRARRMRRATRASSSSPSSFATITF